MRRTFPDTTSFLMLLAAFGLLVGGVTLPVVEVTQLWLFTSRFSILDGIGTLFREGDMVLGTVVLIFSIIFPGVKITLGLAISLGADANVRRLHHLELMGKWSMLDVLVVGLIVFSVKAQLIADATTQPGLFLFLGSVILAMVATWRLRKLSERQPAPLAIAHGRHAPGAMYEDDQRWQDVRID